MINANVFKEEDGTTVVEVEGHAVDYICSSISTLMQTYLALGGSVSIENDGHMIAKVPPMQIDEELNEYGKFMITGMLLVSKDERSLGQYVLSSEV